MPAGHYVFNGTDLWRSMDPHLSFVLVSVPSGETWANFFFNFGGVF